MNLLDLGVLTRNRRTELGLSQAQLASMSGLSRTTINLLENGSLNDLGMAKAADLMNVLGIEMQLNAPIRKKPHALLMASRSASVSYRESRIWPRLSMNFQSVCWSVLWKKPLL